MATTLCGAKFEHENGEEWDCILEVDPEVDDGPHYGPYHFDNLDPGQSRGWADVELPLPPPE